MATQGAGREVVLAIPDLHCPFEHPDALEFLKTVRDKFKPTKIVCLGDEADFAGFSRFPKDPDGLGPGLELQKAIEHLIPFYLAFPKAMVCFSNHTVRPLKMMFMAGLPEAMYPTYSTLLNAPDGWSWADHWMIDGVRYFHGEGRSGQYAHINFLRGYKTSVVHGHVHSWGSVSHDGVLFAVNSGCLIDETAYCFKYARTMVTRPSLGCSIINKGRGAQFIPMILDDKRRWIGEL